jgi:molybdopterin synthase sulfur carrier subunit
VKVRYFAWVRERVGLAEEEIAPPTSVRTVADLILWQQQRGENYAAAFANAAMLRTALDHQHAKPGTPIANVAEVAFFPPMTGG